MRILDRKVIMNTGTAEKPKPDFKRKVIQGIGLGIVFVALLIALPVTIWLWGPARFAPLAPVVTFGSIGACVFREAWAQVSRARARGKLWLLAVLGATLVGGMAAGVKISLLPFPLAPAVTLLVAAILVPADVGAQLGGRKYGFRRLPKPLDNKTWEGIQVALAVSLLSGMVSFALISAFWVELPFQLLLLVLVGPVLAVGGDLVQSFVKRRIEVKDMGSMLGEHGSFSERADSAAGLLILSALLTL